MKNRIFQLVAVLFISLSVTSCNKEKKRKGFNEGEIFYSVEYVKNPSSISKELMPREMVISFKDDKIRTELKAPVGNIGITTITNPALGIYDTYVNMLAIKYCYEGTHDDTLPIFSSMRSLTYQETGKEKTICGFKCREVLVFLKGTEKPYSIWYTDQLDVKNPNRLTPFSGVKGVLMNFFYVFGDAEIKLTAQEVYLKSVPERSFEKKKNYKVVTSSYMDTLIQKMIAF